MAYVRLQGVMISVSKKKKERTRNDKIMPREERANSATPGRRDEVVRG